VDKILEEHPAAIQALQSGKSHEDTHYHQHLEAERLFLASCKISAETDVEAMGGDYIYLLSKYDEARYVTYLLTMH